MAELRTALLSGLTPEDMVRLAKKLLDMALAGDLAATKLLLGYAVGEPEKHVDPDDLEGRELRYQTSLLDDRDRLKRAESFAI